MVALEKSDKSYRAIFLENAYIQLLLPEIGGGFMPAWT